MYWNEGIRGSKLAPEFRGSSTLRSNVKHTFAVEEHGDFFKKQIGVREPLHPDARFHRRKLEIRAYAPMQKSEHPDFDHFQTIQGQVERQTHDNRLHEMHDVEVSVEG